MPLYISTVLTMLAYGQANDEKITGSTDLLAEFSSMGQMLR